MNAVPQEMSHTPSEQPAGTLPFGERRSRPRHGTIQLIEDVVYRALREQASARAILAVDAVPLEAPPTLSFYSDLFEEAAATQVFFSALDESDPIGSLHSDSGEPVCARSLRPVAGKFFQLLFGKYQLLSLLKPAA